MYSHERAVHFAPCPAHWRTWIAAALCACVTERPVALPNGTQGWAIRCPGAARDISDCMNEAAKACGGKYQILDRDGNVVGGAAVATGNGAVWVQGVHRTLIVSCG
jgi:hypothetical protein